MDINIRINLTPGTARRIGYVSLTLFLGGLATIAHALPVQFVSHQRLTASQLNQNFEALETRLAAVEAAVANGAPVKPTPIITEWKSYTPSLTRNGNEASPVGNQTTVGYYRRVGNSAEVRVTTDFTAAPESHAQYWQWGLPDDLTIDLFATGSVGGATIGGGLAEQGTASFSLGPYIRSGKGISASPAGATSNYVADTSPVVFAKGGRITLFFTVPIAAWGINE